MQDLATAQAELEQFIGRNVVLEHNDDRRTPRSKLVSVHIDESEVILTVGDKKPKQYLLSEVQSVEVYQGKNRTLDEHWITPPDILRNE